MTSSEREKSERHFLRYFMDKKLKPDCYQDLEKKHGKMLINEGLQIRETTDKGDY